MKNYVTLSLLLMAALQPVGAAAQSTWVKEWFNQKSTQREYLIQQIAALRVYVGYARKGYEIYNKGLNAIGKFKDGEFSLHDDFFLSLKGINPEIARYARVADIARLQVKTVKSYNGAIRLARDGGNFRVEEISYLTRVYGRLLEDCASLIDELVTLTTSNKLELQDDERIQRIDRLYDEMMDKYRFAESFGNEVKQLNQSRLRERSDVEYNKQLNNLKHD